MDRHRRCASNRRRALNGIRITRPSCCYSSHLLFLLFLLLTPLVLGGGEGNREDEAAQGKQKPDPAERAIGITSLSSRWDAFRTWAKLAWINFRPPDYRFAQGGSNAGEVMKEAATRSFETTKGTAEQAAMSAGKMAGEAMEKTRETLKRAVSTSDGEPDAEL